MAKDGAKKPTASSAECAENVTKLKAKLKKVQKGVDKNEIDDDDSSLVAGLKARIAVAEEALVAAKKAEKGAAAMADSDDESSDEPKPKAKAKPAPAKKAAAPVSDSSDSDAPAPKAKAKAAPTKKAAAAVPDSDDSGDEPAPKVKRAKDDSDDESDEKPAAPPPKKNRIEVNAKGEEDLTVFVGGLPFSCNETTVKKDFGECGGIERFNMPMNDDGRPRGIAFITYTGKAGVEAALKFNDTDYGGRYIKVNLASERPPKGEGKGKDGKDGKGGKGKSDRNDELTAFVAGLPFSDSEVAPAPKPKAKAAPAKKAESDSDDSDPAPAPKPKAKAAPAKKADSDSDDSDAPPPKAKAKAKAAPAKKADSDSDESDAPAPKPKPKAAPTKKAAKSDSDSDSEEAPAPKAKAKPKVAPAKKAESNSDESDAPAPKPKAKAKAAPAKKADSDSDESDAPAPKPKAKAGPAKKAPKPDSDSDSEEAPAPKAKAKPKAAPAKKADSDSDDSEDEPAPKAKAKAPPAKRATAEDDDDSDSSPPPAKKAKAAAPAPAKKRAADDDDDEAEVAPERPTKKLKEEGKSEEELTVFVGSLPFSCEEAALRKDFGECGEITKLHFPMNDEGRPRGIAFITYASTKGVEAALAFNNTDYGGRFIKVNRAGDRPPKGEGKGKKGEKGDKGGGGNNDELTAFVAGLPFDTDEGTLRKDFEECGEIVRIGLPLNDEGRPRGIAFIQFSTKEGVEKAIKFHDTEYGGRWIRVSCAADRGGKDGKGKDGKGKDGKDGKGKKGKGKGKAPSMSSAKQHGGIVESEGTKQTFESGSDDD
eukprot:NODE_672_length_2849_cov_3.641440.p1 GENE.NODE_672_length_2849_cov_3.641440~~NODE_672_length_2849_cov_3.641440.p1  ORF type:complete len:847 (-),score=284.11 NODE_672_length_2849_cov_3.641440:309-2762(-)